MIIGKFFLSIVTLNNLITLFKILNGSFVITPITITIDCILGPIVMIGEFVRIFILKKPLFSKNKV